MSKQRESGISWTERTWNPIRGCSRVSEGCRNCYAERIAGRFSGPWQPYEGLTRPTAGGPRWTGEVRVIEERLYDPLQWQKPSMVFVNSMSDLFHESLADADILRIFGVMADAKRHTFQVLTKRAERMKEFIERRIAAPLTNVWLGVSVENQQAADERIPKLLATPATVRWVSAEPLLGPIGFPPEVIGIDLCCGSFETCEDRHLCGHGVRDHDGALVVLDWVVVGGESGPGARPMNPDWARRIRDDCETAGVPFHFKQWGEFDEHGNRVGKRVAGHVLDGREHRAMPEVRT